MNDDIITTLIVDWGGVCFTDGTSAFIDKVCRNYSVSEESVRKLLKSGLGSDYRCGLITYDEFWNAFTDTLGIDRSQKRILSDGWNQEYRPQKEVLDILHILSKEYKVYYLSDNLKERVDYLEQTYGITKLFHGGVFSFEVGCRKPDPIIYDKVVALSGEQPQKCVYIDDQPKFLPPAQALGMKTILFRNPLQLKEELMRELIWKFGL